MERNMEDKEMDNNNKICGLFDMELSEKMADYTEEQKDKDLKDANEWLKEKGVKYLRFSINPFAGAFGLDKMFTYLFDEDGKNRWYTLCMSSDIENLKRYIVDKNIIEKYDNESFDNVKYGEI